MKQLSFWVMLLMCITAFSQDLTVTVTDFSTFQGLSEIKVTLINSSRNISMEQTTDALGKATFKSLPTINGYVVKFEGNDQYESAQSSVINIRSNENPSVVLSILSKNDDNTLDTVVINSQSSNRINRRDAEVSFELEATEIQEIPVEGRDITRVLFRLPNVTQATGFFPEAPNVSVNGANPLFTSYTIDGMDNNERFLGGQRFAIPSGFVNDITVFTNNYSAEQGLTENGVIDVTTKSGTNELTGEAFFITRPGPSIDGTSQFAQRDLSGNQVKDGFARYQAGVGVGGALVKDKTFYYLNIEHTTDVKDNLLTSPQLGVAETVEGTNTFNYLSAKIDHKWSDSFRSSLRANVGFVDIERQGGGLDGGALFPSAGDTQERNSVNIALKNSYNIGDVFAESNIQYSRFRWNYSQANNFGSPQVTVRNPADETIAIIGNPGYIFDALENTVQFQQKFKYYLDNHSLKAGLNYIRGDHELLGGGNPSGNYTVDLTQAQLDALRARNLGGALNINDLPSDVEVTNYGVELRPAQYGTDQSIYSIYAEDLWSVSDRLNVTLGLRYDYDNLSKGGSDEGDKNNFAPRLNLNYKLTEKSSLRGGYAISYGKIPYAVYSDALQQNTTSEDYQAQIQEFVDLGILPSDTNIDRVTFDGNLTANVAGVSYLNGPTAASLQDQREGVFSNERRILNPNGYDNPYSHQFAIGYQVQVEDDKLFFVDLIHNRGEDLLRLRNLNAAAEYTVDPDNVVVRTQAEADATRPIPIANNSAVIDGQTRTGVARSVVITENGGKSRYYAASFNLQKSRGDDNYSYRINYTLASLKNDTEDINFRAQDGNNYGDEYGPSINDRRHNINSIFNYYPLEGTTITLANILQSGQPINRIPDALLYGTTDLNGDGSGFGDAYQGNSDRSPGEARNSDRLPWSVNFDLGIQHQFKINGDKKLELRADVFNVFNVENLSGYSNNATQSNQIQAGPASSGRFVQRNAGPPRQFQFGVRYLF
ncbi:TonB-dependent receptor [Nonlabens sp.]|uniref:TonB-dependent receptor n=1 Tax=Nonlabens sp. TaxID=1888209 RepID=UPI0032668062